MPGVIIIEAMAQMGGILVMSKLDDPQNYLTFFAKIDKVRFRKRVRPGDTIDLFSKVINEKRGIWKFDCKAELNNEIVCSATILCADRKAL